MSKKNIILISIARKLAGLFYDEKYLRGRYFDQRKIGWKWVLIGIWRQKFLGFNRHIPWPASPFIGLSSATNIIFDPDDLNNFQTFGCYFQNFSAKIYLGKHTYIAPNVGIITSNHDPENPEEHLPGADVILGEHCWIGMNSVILPGVLLGPHTTVGAGSVVTKSFPDGHCIIAGSPARIVRELRRTSSGSDGAEASGPFC